MTLLHQSVKGLNHFADVRLCDLLEVPMVQQSLDCQVLLFLFSFFLFFVLDELNQTFVVLIFGNRLNHFIEHKIYFRFHTHLLILKFEVTSVLFGVVGLTLLACHEGFALLLLGVSNFH